MITPGGFTAPAPRTSGPSGEAVTKATAPSAPAPSGPAPAPVMAPRPSVISSRPSPIQPKPIADRMDSPAPAHNQPITIDANSMRKRPDPETPLEDAVDLDIPLGDSPLEPAPADSPADDLPALDAAAEPETAPEPKPAAKPGARSYDDLTPEQAEIARKLPNAAYAQARKVFEKANLATKELEELRSKAKAPSAMYEHPMSYILNEEFQSADAAVNQATGEYEHYTNQLIAIKQGKPWYTLNYDPKTGAPVYQKNEAREDGTIDVSAEVSVSQALGAIAQFKDSNRSKLQQIVANHKSQRADVERALSIVDSKLFPSTVVEKFTPAETKLYNNAMNLVPAFAGHPLSPLFGKAAVSVQRLIALNGKLQVELAKHNKIKTIQTRAGTSPSGAGSATTSKDQVVTFE